MKEEKKNSTIEEGKKDLSQALKVNPEKSEKRPPFGDQPLFGGKSRIILHWENK